MKHFIPAWYSQKRWWADKAEPFYNKRLVTEFDDLISLMNMHQKHQIDFDILVLNYFPDLRTFLHRHQLFEANYWSLFDEIQGFSHRTPQAIDYRQLQWPAETEFVFTPFLMRGVTSPSTYTNIYFNQEGYIVWLEDFEGLKKQRRYIFDDRGWLSAIRNYDENGQDVNQQYMTADGDCILTEDLVTKQIVVSDKYRHRFDQAEYATMTEFIQAQFKHYTAKHYQVDDVKIAAADDRHNALITENIAPEHLCFSIYSQRNKELNDQTLASVHKGQYWLVDRQDHEVALMLYQSKHHLDNQLMRITPFDAQVLPNISSQLYETYIGLWLDGLVEQDMQRIVTSLTAYIQAHEGYRLLLLTKHDQNEVSPWLKEHIKIINDKYNEVEPDDEGVNQLVAEDEDYVKLLELQHVPFEMDLFEVVSKLRIVIDLNQEPDLFLQICSISAGLPQINQRETEYVTHDKNGKIISSEVEMIAALDYFLDHLKHWNYSFAYSIKLVDEYASEQIIDQLDRLIEGEMHGA